MVKNYTITTLLVTIIVTFGKLLGFIREAYFASVFGISKESDVFQIANTIPTIMLTSVSLGITATVIPALVGIIKNNNDTEGIKYLNKFISVIIFIGTIIVLASEFLSYYFIKIAAPGFDESMIGLGNQLLKIMLPVILLFLLCGVFSGYLQAKGKFKLVAVISVPYNIIYLLILYLLKDSIDIYAAALAVLGSVFGQLLFLIVYSYKQGYRYQFIYKIFDSEMKNTIRLSIPVIISSILLQIGMFIDQYIASSLPTGSVAAINYANRIQTFLFQIFSISIITTFYPIFSQLLLEKKYDEFNNRFNEANNLLMFVSFPTVVFSMLFSNDIVKIIFERGAFTEEATLLTSMTFMYLIPSLIGLGFIEIFNRTFYALKKTNIVIINSLIMIIISIPFAFYLSTFLGVQGIAIARSSAFFIGILFVLFALSKIESFSYRSLVTDATKFLVSSGLSGLITLYLFKFLHLSNFYIQFALKGIIFVGLFGLIGLVLKIELMTKLINSMKKKIRMYS